MMNAINIGSTLQNGKYRIERVLGQGGFGITYLAVHTILDKQVAIKEFFPKDFCDRDESTSSVTLGTTNTAELVNKLRGKFIKEAKNIARLHHPNIVSIQDIFEENNTAYYIMDYIEGVSLEDMLKSGGALKEDKALSCIRAVSSAVAYMHSESMNHLDIKPANIMIRDSDGCPVLIDFGTAKQYDADGEQTSTMAPGFTHGYAPIEQYKPGGVATFTPQTDIYALGATLYALLTGKKPPHYTDIMEDGIPKLPASISKAAFNCIEHAMKLRKSERPSTVAEFLAYLQPEGKGGDENKEDVRTTNLVINKIPEKSSYSEETIIDAGKELVHNTENSDTKAALCDIIDDELIVDDMKFVDLGLSVLWAESN